MANHTIKISEVAGREWNDPDWAPWRERPVWKAKERTWKKAAELGLCTIHFRSPRHKRDVESQQARDIVAGCMLTERFTERFLK
jgi:hypothetical protein